MRREGITLQEETFLCVIRFASKKNRQPFYYSIFAEEQILEGSKRIACFFTFCSGISKRKDITMEG